MRLATYNVHHGAPDRGPVDLESTIEVCRAIAPDLLAVQELDALAARSGLVDQPQRLAAELGMQLLFAPTVRMGERGHYGHALLSRHAFADVELVELTVTAGREPRTAILASTRLGDSTAEVAALHLENPRRLDRPPMAAQQAQTVFELIGTRADASGRPAIVLGDLNLDAPTARTLADEAGFELADGPNTFPATRPRTRIDHVAIRGVSIRWVEVPASDASDHRPLLVVADGAHDHGA